MEGPLGGSPTRETLEHCQKLYSMLNELFLLTQAPDTASTGLWGMQGPRRGPPTRETLEHCQKLN